MKIILILLTNINNLPPARNLLLQLNKIDVEVFFITMYKDSLPEEIINSKNIKISSLQNNVARNKVDALLKRFSRRLRLRKTIKKNINNDDVIWTITDYDAMEVGNRLLNKYRHVMQLMELIKDIPFFDELPFLKAKIYKAGKTAELVIVPEENRALLQQKYWSLSNTPFVLPNKSEIDFSKVSETVSSNVSNEINCLFEKIGNKKVIIYQGTFGFERRLDEFIEAAHTLGEDYCVLLMGSRTKDLENLLEKYNFVYFIPFIPPPYHLLVTSRCYIGILSYVNNKNIKHFDPMNAVYCAPNKLFEYSFFGIPMVGNDIPGLSLPFSKFICGEVSKVTSDSLAIALKKIISNYDSYKKGSFDLYKSVDTYKIVCDIVDLLKKRN